MTLRIREAAPDDIAAMHAIRLTVSENRLSDPAWLTPDVYRACLADSGTANTWVCEMAARIVGFSTARIAQRDIWALFVDPEHEGRGAGKQLLDTASQWLFDRGVAVIELTTAPGMRADGFYQRLGWQRGTLTPKGDVTYCLPSSQARVPANQETATC